MQAFDAGPLQAVAPSASLSPVMALEAIGRLDGFGNGIRHLAALDESLAMTEMLPNAAAAIHLPAAFTGLPPKPIYGRAPDAKPPAKRKPLV